MKRQIAIKRLTVSDLSLFKSHYDKNATHQKGINLNASILVKRFYPTLNTASATGERVFLVSLHVYGPNGEPEHMLPRKVIKDRSGKNWRLNGEMIPNPPGDDQRYNSLAPGDLAVMEFTGDDRPVGIRMALISATSEYDAAAYQALNPLVKSMDCVPDETLSEALDSGEVTDEHPIRHLLIEDALEDAALGGAQGVERLFRRGLGRRISRTELTQARQRAHEVGCLGESLIQSHLVQEEEAGRILGFEWVAEVNAVAPFDFQITLPDLTTERIDAKSTSGEFERTLHVSLAELHTMADTATPYRLYRVYDLDEHGGTLRVSEPMASFAQGVIDSLGALPPGVSPDGFSLDPTLLTFGAPVAIRQSYDAES